MPKVITPIEPRSGTYAEFLAASISDPSMTCELVYITDLNAVGFLTPSGRSLVGAGGGLAPLWKGVSPSLDLSSVLMMAGASAAYVLLAPAVYDGHGVRSALLVAESWLVTQLNVSGAMGGTLDLGVIPQLGDLAVDGVEKLIVPPVNVIQNFVATNGLETSMDLTLPVCTGLSLVGSAITSLTLDAPQVTDINVGDCQLDAAALNALFAMLPISLDEPEIEIAGNPGTATCDKSIAEANGWIAIS